MDTDDEEEKRRRARSAGEPTPSPEAPDQNPSRPFGPGNGEPPNIQNETDALRRENEKLVAENMRAQEDNRRHQNEKQADALAREHARILSRQADDLRDLKSRTDALGQEIEQKYDGFEKDGGKFAHEKQRYADARGEQMDAADPYGTIQRAAGTEYAMFAREQREYEERIQKEADLTQRTELTMQKEIRAAEHLAFTSNRIADQGELIAGFKENDLSEQFRDRAAEQEKIAEQTRERYTQRGMHAAWEQEERAAYEQSEQSARREDERRARYEAKPISAEFGNSSAEVTDSKAEKLAKLAERWSETAREVTDRQEGPTRPMAGSGGISR